MNSDRAHRLLNTILLVFIIGLSSVAPPEAAPTAWDYLMRAAFLLAMIAALVIMIRIATRNVDEIREYLGMAEASP